MLRSGWHLAALLLATSGCAARPHLTASMPYGSVEYWLGGTGTPTIVLESSIGDDFTSWDFVMDSLAATTTTVAYSRSGYGDSRLEGEDMLGMRTGTDVAVALRAFLEQIDAAPPFVLVGHSIGGLYALSFAGLYPEDVVGLVLIDSRLPAFSGQCELAGVPPCDPTPALIVSAPTHIRAELLGLGATEGSVPTAAELGGLPVTLIASEYSDLDEVRLGHRVLVQVQRDFASELPSGRFLVGEGSGHYVHRDRPDLVIEEVLRLVRSPGPADAARNDPPLRPTAP